MLRHLKSPVGCEAGFRRKCCFKRKCCFRRKCCFDNLFGKLLGLDTAGDETLSIHCIAQKHLPYSQGGCTQATSALCCAAPESHPFQGGRVGEQGASCGASGRPVSPRYVVSLQATPRAITDPFLSMARHATSADYLLAPELALHAVTSECHAARACCLVYILSRGCMTQLLWGSVH